MSKDKPRKPNYMGIYMFSSLELSAPIVDSLSRCLEEQPVFTPETWGPSERVKLPYKRKEVLRAWDQHGSIAWVQLLRTQVPKYEASIDAVAGYFDIETDGPPARKDWPAFFELADRLAAVLKPRYATAHIVWSRPGLSKQDAKLDRLMDSCGVVYPREFRPNGPLGLGLRTYFGADVLDFIGRDTLLAAPARATELDWGGIRIDLWKEVEELDGSVALVHRWKTAMDYFEPLDVFAHPTIKGTMVEFKGTDSWKAFVAAKSTEKLAVDVKPDDETSDEDATDAAISALNVSQYSDDAVEDVDITGVDLTYSSLTEIKVDGLVANATSFIGGNLTRASIQNSELQGADFSHATLHEASFFECNLAGANFSDADLGGCNIMVSFCGDACFDRVVWTKGDAGGSDFRGASMRGARIERCDASQSFFSDADLTDASFAGSDLRKSDFKGAILKNTDFTGAKLTGAKFDKKP
jgi:uncharacterized protein YjbI with pentapeptide repeats